MTGGSVYLYSSYNYETHGQNLFYTVYSNLLKPFVYDVDFTVRVSNGLNICGYGIANNYKESRDVSLSMMDPASSFTVTFEHEEK